MAYQKSITHYPALETGLIAAASGICMSALQPSPEAYGLVVAGLAVVVAHFTFTGKYDAIFYNLGIRINDTVSPTFVAKYEHESSTVYEYTIPAGLSLDDFSKHADALETFAGCSVDLSIHNRRLFLREIREQKIYNYKPAHLKGHVPLLIGYDRSGRLVSADLAAGEPHLYIAGETGSGKSTALRAIITNLIIESQAEIYLVDLKNGVEFGLFRHAVKGLARTEQEAEELLKSALTETERRYNLMYDADCESIEQYNKVGHMPYRVIVVDELATLIDNKVCTRLLEQLAAKARACGIHLILATQRPDAKVLNGRIKANVTNVLGLKTIDATNSRVIIDHDGLERLCGAGQGIFRREGKETLIQCPYISSADAKTLIAPFNRQEKTQDKTAHNYGGFKNVDWPRL